MPARDDVSLHCWLEQPFLRARQPSLPRASPMACGLGGFCLSLPRPSAAAGERRRTGADGLYGRRCRRSRTGAPWCCCMAGNFPSSYWAPVIETLSEAGYRVVVPDQIGFGKSSKPLGDLHFDTLARNTDRVARSSADCQGRRGGAFAGRHAGRADRARLSRPDRTSGADRPDRAGGLPALRAADADRKDSGERGQAHRRRLPQAARDQLRAEAAARTGHAVHRRAFQYQGQRRISALAARLRQLGADRSTASRSRTRSR